MKRNRHKKRRPLRLIRLWTLPQAKGALSYLQSITSSLREHWLEAQSRRTDMQRLANVQGRPDRTRILASEKADEDKTRAEDKFTEALNELMGIDVYLLDPVQGTAFIPFKKEEELAWFVFELFDPKELKSWRLHQDPLETRRPIAELNGEPATPTTESKAG